MSNMAFRIKLRGQLLVEADSAGEAIEFLKRLGVPAESFPAVSSMPAKPDRRDWGRAQLAILWGWVAKRPRQADILRALLNAHPDGLSKEHLLREMGANSGKQLAGALSGLAKYAKKLGFAPDSLCLITPAQQNGKRTTNYSLDEPFRTVLKDHLASSSRSSTHNDSGGGGGEEEIPARENDQIH